MAFSWWPTPLQNQADPKLAATNTLSREIVLATEGKYGVKSTIGVLSKSSEHDRAARAIGKLSTVQLHVLDRSRTKGCSDQNRTKMFQSRRDSWSCHKWSTGHKKLQCSDRRVGGVLVMHVRCRYSGRINRSGKSSHDSKSTMYGLGPVSKLWKRKDGGRR